MTVPSSRAIAPQLEELARQPSQQLEVVEISQTSYRLAEDEMMRAMASGEGSSD